MRYQCQHCNRNLIIDIKVTGKVLREIDPHSGKMGEDVTTTINEVQDKNFIVHCESCLLPDTRYKLQVTEAGKVTGIVPKDAADKLTE